MARPGRGFVLRGSESAPMPTGERQIYKPGAKRKLRGVALAGFRALVLAALAVQAWSAPADPVAWRAWGPEALSEARQADKPLLLILRDPSCAPCAADERDALADPDAAHLIRAAFVAASADAWERPDLTDLFASLLDEPGAGRTLVVFLLGDGRPYAAQWGLARDDQPTKPGLRTLLTRRLSDFRNDRGNVEAAAARNLERLRRAQSTEPPRRPLGRDVVDGAMRGLTESFDAKSGGFGPAGDVPVGAPRLLLEEGARRRDHAAGRMAVAALDRWASVEAGPAVLWRDAVRLAALVQAYAITGSLSQRATAEALATRVLAEDQDPGGGFTAMPRASGAAGAETVVAGWNGLMIGALAASGTVLGRPADLEAAVKAAHAVRDRLGAATALRRSARGAAAGPPAFLEDYAYLAEGLLDLHAATGDSRFGVEAIALVDAAIGRFLDPAGSGFFSTDAAHGPAPVRLKQGFDAPRPSPNGVMARVLLRLDRSTGEQRYGSLARTTVLAFIGDLQRAPRGMETLAGAAADIVALDSASAAASAAQPGRPARAVVGPVTLEARVMPSHVAAGGRALAELRLTVAEGWRIVARDPGVKDLFGVSVSVIGEGLTSEGPLYPEARQDRGPWRTGAVSVYAGEAVIKVPVRVAAGSVVGERRLGLRVVFQPCDGSSCRPPQSAHLEVQFAIDPAR